LRERFNPTRLKREVDIMRRLNHPNIIQFIEVYEDSDHLMMVMDYCPGQELFDVILSRKYFKEDDARPIFFQVSKALYYLHSLNIIHRDIKPENILILDSPDPVTGSVIAKLLDFGLSKQAGGSEAKTFVGTPCYLAPEVEYTSKGLGGTYGLAADCWSLGAVLYVMLVARFPEFEQDSLTGKVVVKLSPQLWGNVSNEAKDLIRGLMNTNPNARLTMYKVLQHPWLGKFRVSEPELTKVAVANMNLNHQLQEEAELEDEEEIRNAMAIAQHEQQQQQVHYQQLKQANEATMMITEVPHHQTPEITAGGNVVTHHQMIVRQKQQNDVASVIHPNAHPHLVHNSTSGPGNMNGNGFTPESLKLAPLLHLQRSIATCFEEAHEEYSEYPEVAAQIRRGAVLCRHQLIESTKMLRKVEQTAKEVLEMFPDLELAVEEDEPKLAAEFFNLVKQWVVELKDQVDSTQKINKASMNQIQKVVEQSTTNLKREQKEKASATAAAIAITSSNMVAKQLMESIYTKLKAQSPNGQLDVNNLSLDANSMFELFFNLFNANELLQGQQQQQQPQQIENAPSSASSRSSSQRESETEMEASSPSGMMDVDHHHSSMPPFPPLSTPPRGLPSKTSSSSSLEDIDEEDFIPSSTNSSASKKVPTPKRNKKDLTVETVSSDQEDSTSSNASNMITEFIAASTRSPKTSQKLVDALHKLRQVSGHFSFSSILFLLLSLYFSLISCFFLSFV
jgi:hypothetical protein